MRGIANVAGRARGCVVSTHSIGPNTVNRTVNLPREADEALARLSFEIGCSRGSILRDALRVWVSEQTEERVESAAAAGGVRERRFMAAAVRALAEALGAIALAAVLTWAAVCEADRVDWRRMPTSVRVVRVSKREGF